MHLSNYWKGVKRRGKSWKGKLFTDFQWSGKMVFSVVGKDVEVTFLSLSKSWKISSFQLYCFEKIISFDLSNVRKDHFHHIISFRKSDLFTDF